MIELIVVVAAIVDGIIANIPLLLTIIAIVFLLILALLKVFPGEDKMLGVLFIAILLVLIGILIIASGDF